MKSNLNMIFVFGFIIQISLLKITAQTRNDSTYVKEIIKTRQTKDTLFLSAHSPLEKKDIEEFKGLKYFAINPEYKLDAIFKKNKKPKSFKMKTSTERLPVYLVYGTIEFTISGQKFILNVYQSKDLLRKPGLENYLLIPFTDETSGNETYGGGRFLDFTIPKSEIVNIDFNLAYNPYCAYSHKFSCPIPPKENHLKIKIESGEKVFKE